MFDAELSAHSSVGRSTEVTPEREAILVTGGTGFIGSRLCEVLYLGKNSRPRAFVHSPGKASYITRYPLDFALGDVTEFSTVCRAMEGCTFVVHLAIGSDHVMLKGLENVLRAAVEAKVKRFVHVSSVKVYGANPPLEAQYETAVATKTGDSYGDIKLRQEKLVIKYGTRYGLPFVILRPPFVFGPLSGFTLAMLDRLRSGSLPVVERGMNTCNLVYIDNFIEAILLCLVRDQAVGEIFFVTDKDRVTWRKCIQDYCELLRVEAAEASSDQFDFPSPPRLQQSLRQFSSIILSREFRSAVMSIPFTGVVGNFLYNRYTALPEKQRNYIRFRFKAAPAFSCNCPGHRRYDGTDNLIRAQRRRVVHSCEKAEQLLGYTAPVSYAEGMKLTKEWLRFARII
jgi:nucleoside-diphosphate-sugar epimerase